MKTPDKHGHPRFYELLEEFAELHSKKNKDYAAGGKPTGNFDRVATILSMYPGLPLSSPMVVAYIYMLKQFDAVLWSLSRGYDTAVESRHDKMQDMAVYSTLAMVLEEEEKKNPKAPEVTEQWVKGVLTYTPGLPKLQPCGCGGIPFLNWGNGYYWIECPKCHTVGTKTKIQVNAQGFWNVGDRHNGERI